MGYSRRCRYQCSSTGVLHFRFMQRASYSWATEAAALPENRMRGDVFDAFAVDVNLAAILQALQVLFTG